MLLDWWAQYNLVDPASPFWGMRYSKYKAYVAALHPTGGWPTGWRKLAVEEARKQMAPYTHVATTAELDVPEPIITGILVDLEPTARRLYDHLERDFVAQLPGGAEASAEHGANPGAPPPGTYELLRQAARRRASADHLTGQARRGPRAAAERPTKHVLIAARFLQDIDRLTTMAQADAGTLRVIEGVTPEAQRATINDWFQRAKDADAPGPGASSSTRREASRSTLTNADALILYSLDYSSINYRQMIGRGGASASARPCRPCRSSAAAPSTRTSSPGCTGTST